VLRGGYDPAQHLEDMALRCRRESERHGEAIYRFKNGMRPSDFFRRNVVLSF
jgi:hypothetical protein